MATSVLNPDGTVTLDDGAGHQRKIQILPNASIGGWVDVNICDPDTGDVRAIPMRLKMTDSGGRVAADLPGCDASVCIVDANGSIANG
jgi:hypothetical protein